MSTSLSEAKKMSSEVEFNQGEFSWSASELRRLRCRMGLSRADFARTLGCEMTLVSQWETGQKAPADEHRNILLGFHHQAESNCEKVHRRPVAEVLMNSRGLTQIHDMEVMDCLIDGELKKLSFS
jgi:DNA-binding transcriptional regulator YiaG